MILPPMGGVVASHNHREANPVVSRDVQAGGGPYGRLMSNRKAMRAMNGSTMRSITGVLVALAGAMAAGCGADDDGDKAGGSSAPTVLRLASANDAEQPDGPLARDFASRVASSPAGRCAFA